MPVGSAGIHAPYAMSFVHVGYTPSEPGDYPLPACTEPRVTWSHILDRLRALRRSVNTEDPAGRLRQRRASCSSTMVRFAGAPEITPRDSRWVLFKSKGYSQRFSGRV